jgi:hypothetical protein
VIGYELALGSLGRLVGLTLDAPRLSGEDDASCPLLGSLVAALQLGFSRVLNSPLSLFNRDFDADSAAGVGDGDGVVVFHNGESVAWRDN